MLTKDSGHVNGAGFEDSRRPRAQSGQIEKAVFLNDAEMRWFILRIDLKSFSERVLMLLYGGITSSSGARIQKGM